MDVIFFNSRDTSGVIGVDAATGEQVFEFSSPRTNDDVYAVYYGGGDTLWFGGDRPELLFCSLSGEDKSQTLSNANRFNHSSSLYRSRTGAATPDGGFCFATTTPSNQVRKLSASGAQLWVDDGTSSTFVNTSNPSMYVAAFSGNTAVLYTDSNDSNNWRLMRLNSSTGAVVSDALVAGLPAGSFAIDNPGRSTTGEQIIHIETGGGSHYMVFISESNIEILLMDVTAVTSGWQFNTMSTASATHVYVVMPSSNSMITVDRATGIATETAVTGIADFNTDGAVAYSSDATKAYVSFQDTSTTTHPVYEITLSSSAANPTPIFSLPQYKVRSQLRAFCYSVPAYTVTGNVTNGGSPASTSLYLLSDTGHKILNTTSDGAGVYSFTTLHGGDVSIVCKHPTSGGWQVSSGVSPTAL